MSEQAAVTVIGLGSMGTAQAHALLKRGHRVTVWNRTAERAAPLAACGAFVARTAAEAIAASPLVIMCVYDYGAADVILSTSGVAESLSGKTFVQLSTGTPEQVYAQQARVRDCGGRFIAGGIMAYPRSIGRPNCLILFAGDSSYSSHQTTLACLAGSSQYLGPDPVAATGAYFALSAFMIGSLALFFETAAANRNYGISIDTHYLLGRLVTDEILEGMRDGAYRVAAGNFGGTLASIDLTIAGMQEVAKTFNQTGMPMKMTDALVDSLKIASADGAGGGDIAQLTETVWSHRRT
jgi:3-hydroxyisobutyrate dehydrogenase-like beta-hydroxyacid dehydrogenase